MYIVCTISDTYIMKQHKIDLLVQLNCSSNSKLTKTCITRIKDKSDKEIIVLSNIYSVKLIGTGINTNNYTCGINITKANTSILSG